VPAILWQTGLSASHSLIADGCERNRFSTGKHPIIWVCHVERSETSLAVALSEIGVKELEIELVRLPSHSPLPVRGFTVHVTRPTRSILRYAQNDIVGVITLPQGQQCR
jgi:hypothetical protein